MVGGVVEREPELLEAVNQVIDEVVEDGLYLGWMDTAIRMAVSEREADSRGIYFTRVPTGIFASQSGCW